MATLMEIARQTGLSKQTVSHILNTKRGARYAAETVQRVLAAADQLGYRPNGAAQAVSTGRFGSIGLLTSVDASKAGLPPVTLWAVQKELRAADLHLTIGQVTDGHFTSDEGVPKLLREWSIDGLLLSYTWGIPEAMPRLLEHYRVPTIWMNVKRDYDAIRPDDYEAGAQIARRLIALGHRDIAFVKLTTASPHYSNADRFQGYCDAMAAVGLSPWSIRAGHELPEAPAEWQAAEQIVLGRRRPTAIVTYHEDANTFLAVCWRNRIEVPRDLSIAAFRTSSSTLAGVEVTGLAVPSGTVGHQGVPLLLRKIAHPTVPLPTVVLPFRVVDGQTLAAPPTSR